MRKAIWDYVDEWPGIETILIGRPSVEAKVAIGVVLVSDHEISDEFDAGLRATIREARGDDPVVRIFVMRSAYPTPELLNPDSR